MSLPNGFQLLVHLGALQPYNSSKKSGPTGGTITTDKFRLDSLPLATFEIPQRKLGDYEDVPAEGKVPAHKRWNIANVQVHVYDGVKIGEVDGDGTVTGQIEINARSVSPSWSGGERQVHLSINVKPAVTGSPSALVRAWAGEQPDAPESAVNYGPDSKGGNVLVVAL